MPVKHRFLLLGAGLLLAAVVFGGCRSTAFNVAVEGTDNQNRCDDQNQGFIIDVVLLQLTSDAAFRRISPEEFWDNPSALGDDELERETKRLQPGAVWTLNKYKPDKEANFIGVAADFTCLDNQQRWRDVESTGDLRGRELQVRILEQRLDVSVR